MEGIKIEIWMVKTLKQTCSNRVGGHQLFEWPSSQNNRFIIKSLPCRGLDRSKSKCFQGFPVTVKLLSLNTRGLQLIFFQPLIHAATCTKLYEKSSMDFGSCFPLFSNPFEPYSPKLNQIEGLCKWLKDSIINNTFILYFKLIN